MKTEMCYEARKMLTDFASRKNDTFFLYDTIDSGYCIDALEFTPAGYTTKIEKPFKEPRAVIAHVLRNPL